MPDVIAQEGRGRIPRVAFQTPRAGDRGASPVEMSIGPGDVEFDNPAMGSDDEIFDGEGVHGSPGGGSPRFSSRSPKNTISLKKVAEQQTAAHDDLMKIDRATGKPFVEGCMPAPGLL